MTFDTEGIVLRQTKTSKGRTMVLLFTSEQGKLGASTYISETGKSKSSLAIRPFTYGTYRISEKRGYYYIDSGEPIKSYYSLGEDIDKYFAASYALELTDKLVPEGLPQPELFRLLAEYFRELGARKKKYKTLLLAYEIKMLHLLGVFPETDVCVACGKTEGLDYFSVPAGGVLCRECRQKLAEKQEESLIYDGAFDIVKLVKYFVETPLGSFAKIALEDRQAERLQQIVREYMEYHLELGKLKSEGVFSVVK